ncbi:unnamed protein product [Spirodela intermedia]|uniref:Aminopeptidase n=1 Tax=Spirodela intermedia TaxID=51605 RepID=A0A7I8JSN9_SPIIN|nr:unnamed protein product [Spirodela intermedia]CAA6672775.1 unnamed protein product [Spirodela intermedia]
MSGTQSVDLFKGQSRLPKFAVPKRYDLRLTPDLAACKFTGTVCVVVDIVGDTKFLVLNAADLVVTEGSVSFRNQDSSQVGYQISANPVIAVREGSALGEGTIRIGFSGILNDQMKGFYRSTYEYNGEKKNMAVTQFEPADARRCFPCWDEPAFKATFKITLEVPHDLVALSNMPVVEEKLNGLVKTLFFEESPIMSTYLVAVVVGLFDYVEDTASDGTKVRVYCQVGKTSQGNFALDVAVKTLDLYTRYFSVPYSLPKLDMVAIPDFLPGLWRIMVWLLIVKQLCFMMIVAVVVAHELAHQWFGNLVTMEWWTHLWLNEGFATWVSYLAADSLFPEWKIWTQFLDETTEGLRLDALEESHPIEVDVNHASEIDEIFDDISYRKGASVIRMLHSYLGAECFQYACSNAKTEDLWSVLEEESGVPVKMLMNSWTKQKGYPVVTVKIKENSLEFEQSQFLSSGSNGEGQWMVPITICHGSYESQKNFLLKTTSENLQIGEVGVSLFGKEDHDKLENHWIKLNVDQTGFYRVKYDDVLTARLRSAIEGKQLSVADRFGILDDSYALCMACKLPLSSFLSLVDSFREELEYTVLSQLIAISYKVVRIVADATPELLGDVKQIFINLFQFSAEERRGPPRCNVTGELLTVLAELGHDSTRDEALKRFAVFLDDRNTPLLPPDTRKDSHAVVVDDFSAGGICCCDAGVDASNRSGYESLLRIYREADLSQEKGRVLSSLACCPDPQMVLVVLNFLLSSEVRSQDVFYGLAGGSREGRETAWQWLKDNWEHISKTWGSGFLIGRFISSIVSPFSSEEKAEEVSEFFSTRSRPNIARTLRQSIERVRINSNWVQHVRLDDSLPPLINALLSPTGKR